MPEKRLERMRATLPTGYQFGDPRCRTCGKWGHAECWNVPVHTDACALPYARCDCGADPSGLIAPMSHPKGWRPYHETAAEQLERRASKELSVQVLEALSERGAVDNSAEFLERKRAREADEAGVREWARQRDERDREAFERREAEEDAREERVWGVTANVIEGKQH